jgi:ATP-dependent Clp protease ATP-binding subunit ClpB
VWTQIYISPHTKQAIDMAFNEAERLRDEYISTEIAHGIADVNEGPASKILSLMVLQRIAYTLY